MRKISMKWTDRNISRIIKWLGLDCDFAGFFGGRYSGYKSGNGKIITFYFEV